MFTHEIKKPLSVYVKGETTGEYEEHNEVVVSFVGKKGLKALKRLQDIIYKSFADQAKNADRKENTESKDEVLKVEDVFDVLEMTGNSEMLFDEVCGTFKAFATIAGAKLDDKLQDQMEIEDLDGLYQGVLNHFLLPKVCQKMNNMKK